MLYFSYLKIPYVLFIVKKTNCYLTSWLSQEISNLLVLSLFSLLDYSLLFGLNNFLSVYELVKSSPS